jgi:hypothetical protein
MTETLPQMLCHLKTKSSVELRDLDSINSALRYRVDGLQLAAPHSSFKIAIFHDKE